MAVLLGACAGATDALAFFGLGKAFAGIVTGNPTMQLASRRGHGTHLRVSLPTGPGQLD